MLGRLPSLCLLLLLACLAPSCVFYATGNSQVFVSSTPTGARIYVDGEDSGETTPAALDLGGYFGSDHELTIRKNGFETESRTVHHHTVYYTSKIIDGATTSVEEIDFMFWTFGPLFWTFGDFLTPFATKWDYVPRQLHVKLYPMGEAPGKLP